MLRLRLLVPALLAASLTFAEEAQEPVVVHRTNLTITAAGGTEDIGAAVQAALQKALAELPAETRAAAANGAAPLIQVIGGDAVSAEDKQKLTDAVQKALAGVAGLAAPAVADAASTEAGWITLFDGKTLDGWKASENPGCFTVEDGAIKVNGPRSHLFYMGANGAAAFTNFEFEAEVMTRTNSNSGIFIHTVWQEKGWPSVGYECQVNNSMSDPQRTGGLYNTVKINPSPAQDDVWFRYYIKVAGKHVTIKIDGKTVVDFEEPADRTGTIKLSAGTFALQAHDPKSVVFYRNLRARHLP